VFPSLHELFVDYFAGIVFACLDVDRFLYNGIGTAAKSLAGTILVIVMSPTVSEAKCEKIDCQLT
jgi:hypothetical protein